MHMCASISVCMHVRVCVTTAGQLYKWTELQEVSTQSHLTEEALSCKCAMLSLSSNIRAERVPFGGIKGDTVI